MSVNVGGGKVAAEVLRDNMKKDMGDKRDFQAVVEACEVGFRS